MRLKYSYQDYLKLATHTGMGMDLFTWAKLLYQNRFSLSPWYIPKAAFLTLNMALNAPLQLYEHLRFRPKVNRSRIVKPLFILGHPRSGTTYLQYLISKDPTFAYCSTYQGLVPHTFLTAGKLSQGILGHFMPDTRPQDNVKAGPDLPIEEEFATGNMGQASWVHGLYFPKNIYRYFDRYVVFNQGQGYVNEWKKNFSYFIQKLAYRYPDKRLLLKSPSNTGRVKEILELYPDAQFIHIHRDPWEVYLSNERLFEKILPIVGFQHVDNAFMSEYILYAYEKMYRKFLLDKEGIPPTQFVEISYSDLVRDPMDTLEKVYAQLGLGDFNTARPHVAEEARQSGTYVPNAYPHVDADIKEMVYRRWAFAFEAFNYG